MRKHFYSVVLPVLLSCSEIWAVGLTQNIFRIEKLHLTFSKEILWVHSKTSNPGCLAELNRNRLPLWSKFTFSSIRFMYYGWPFNFSLEYFAYKLYQSTLNFDSLTGKLFWFLDTCNHGMSNDIHYKPQVKSSVQHV